MIDTFPHLTLQERSADACTLRRLLEEARAELEDYTSQAEAGGEQLLDRMLDAQCWAARWKRAAKEYRKSANSHADRLATSPSRLLALDAELGQIHTQTAEVCAQIAEEHIREYSPRPSSLPDVANCGRTRAALDIAAAIRERFNIKES